MKPNDFEWLWVEIRGNRYEVPKVLLASIDPAYYRVLGTKRDSVC